MKKLCILMSLAGTLYAPTLQAVIKVQLYQDTGNFSYSNGGEFRAQPVEGLSWVLPFYDSKTKNALGNPGFQTFCIEYNEHFYPGSSHTYTGLINDRAMYGSQPPNGDPISIGTAWLYSQFAKGQLQGYDYNYNSDSIPGGNRTTSAGLVQQAIWWLEGEQGGVNNNYVTLARTELGTPSTPLTDTQVKANANGAFNVAALNLYDASGNFAQDQLVMIPESTTMIAGMLLLLPVGVTGLRHLRRNRLVL